MIETMFKTRDECKTHYIHMPLTRDKLEVLKD
jgi:hypothetical protein